MGKSVYSVEKDEDSGQWVIVNSKVGYVVRECDSKREADLLADSFNHKASQPDEEDPPADPDPKDPPKDPKAKTPPPPKDPPDPDPKDPPKGDPPPDPDPPKVKRSRYWGDSE